MRLAVLVSVLVVTRIATAEPISGARIAIETPVEAFTTPSPVAGISRTIYLERCLGGCDVLGGTTNDAVNLVSTIPEPGQYRLTEFHNTTGETGASADAEWAMVVQCMKEVYSPFDVDVTDVKPAVGPYHLAIIAGVPGEVGLAPNVLGVAPLASNCGAFDNVISFSFANAHGQSELLDRVNNLCWTAAQESAHAFGLDHEFEFVKNGASACNDPMTYRVDCGGQKFYRNLAARCGEDLGVRDCRCGDTQNSHKKLLSVFGLGTPIYGLPVVSMKVPSTGATTLPSNAIATAFSKRGILKLKLFLNGFPFAETPGVEFGTSGQIQADYGLLVPATLPNSIYDVFVRAFDDLGDFTDTPITTVTKGAPCVSADACLPEQRCEAGKCLWDPPVGELGDDCTFPAFCKSFICSGTADEQICTQTCEANDPEGCPSGMECTQGICFFASGGCCSASGEGWMHAGVLTMVVGFVLRRRRHGKSQSKRGFDRLRQPGA
ncbi:MAG: hypothetical protein ABI867_19930 [Kofleriaceae bacterium]